MDKNNKIYEVRQYKIKKKMFILKRIKLLLLLLAALILTIIIIAINI